MEYDYNDQLRREGKANLNSSGDSKSDALTLESVDDAIFTDGNIGVDDTEAGSSKYAVISLANAYFYNDNRPARDAVMYNEPKYETSDEEPIVDITELQLQRHTDKTKQNALDTSVSTGPSFNKKALNLDERRFILLPSRDAITYNASTYETSDEEPIVDIAELQLQMHTEKTSVSTGPSVNKKALYLDETTYRLESFHKHALVIFNHKTFNDPGITERLGTEEDVDVLKRTFENFGFEVTPHDDLEKDALLAEARKFSERDFTDYGCVAVAIFTHGSKDGMLRAKDHLYSEIQVINYFKPTKTKPTLVSKPKIFIIQACRGPVTSPGVPVFEADSVHKDYAEENLQSYYILPLESDLLILHSSYPGCASHRYSEKIEKRGSWFIQKLCEEITKLSPTEHLESIITEVKRVVAVDMGYIEYNTRTRMNQVSKQMPVMTSTLIRKLYLKKFRGQASEETYVDKSRQRSESRHKVRRADSSLPKTSLLSQSEACSCFLEHFTYMSNCLRHFVEENPKDETARSMLNVANAYEDSYQFHKCKVEMCKLISKHLMDKARHSQFYKYLHFVPVERKVTQSLNESMLMSLNESMLMSLNESMSLKSSFSSPNVFLIGIFVAFVAFVFY